MLEEMGVRIDRVLAELEVRLDEVEGRQDQLEILVNEMKGNEDGALERRFA